MESSFIKMCEEFGLGVSLSLAILVMFFFLLKWVLNQQDLILRRSDTQDTAWREIVSQMRTSLDAQRMESREFQSMVQEAHKYQRDEHKEIIGQMREVTSSLGRINGHKN